MIDQAYMSRALQLAELGRYSTHPNPRVGCVIVKNGQIVGEGWHQSAGTPHAEVHALNAAGTLAHGATAYVSLEPCSHHGRTPPCADALIQAGIARVVVAMRDPNPQVAGQGLKRLAAAGIQVEVLQGPLSEQAQQLNPGFIKRMRHALPWVRIKLAMSLDGRTAMANGSSQWITGPEARSDVQRLRACSSVIVSGADTLLHDNARLNVRAGELALDAEELYRATLRHPMRVVIDSRLRVPGTHVFFQSANAWIASPSRPLVLPETAGWLQTAAHQGRVCLKSLLQLLAREHAANEVLIEAGPRLAGAFLQAGLADEIIVYMAPKLMGSLARPLFALPLHGMQESIALDIRDIRRIGNDWRIHCRPCQQTATDNL